MRKGIAAVQLNDITIQDTLFGHYLHKIDEHILQHQWEILNDLDEDTDPTFCIENFKIAAGESRGERKGVVFQDTDLYKWIESVAYCLASGYGMAFKEKADEVIGLISRAQEQDGYLNTYFSVNAPDRKWKNLVEGHELYTAGHLMEAATAYYSSTGNQVILEVARKNADLICKIFGRNEGQIPGYGGHQEVEIGLIKLYRITNDRRYLEQANYFIRQRGTTPNYFRQEMERNNFPEFFPEFKNYDLEYAQADKPPIYQSEATGHAVRCMYMCSAMADLAQEYDDTEMEKACKRIWTNTVLRRMYITGGIGSSGFRERFTTDYDLPNATNYSETCASIGLMMFGQRMAQITGNASYWDIVELALYNTVLAGINLEGNRYFYVNPLEVVPEFCTEHTYMDHVKATRQKWFAVACCPPNLIRTIASLGQYLYGKDDKALYINGFVSSSVDTMIEGGRYRLSMESDYLDSGRIKMHLQLEKDGRCYIRMPGLADEIQLTLDGKIISPPIEDGYANLELTAGIHELQMLVRFEPKWIAANPRVHADAGKVALMKGPIVYCLEEADNGELLSELSVKPGTSVENINNHFYIGNIPMLKYKGIRIHNDISDNMLYDVAKTQVREQNCIAIPYCMWNNRGVGEMRVWQRAIYEA